VLTRETVVRLGRDRRLFGVLTEPSPGAPRHAGTGVLLLNAGMLHNAGPSRIFVTLARQLAALGYIVLRFDFAGIGESPARSDGMRFEEATLIEAAQAMDFLVAMHGAERFITAGLCYGAVQSFRVALSDPRVIGVAMLNPQAFSENSVRHIRSYIEARRARQYLFRVSIRHWDSWRRLLSGHVGLGPLLKALSSPVMKPPSRQGAADDDVASLGRDFASLIVRGVQLLPVYAEKDPGLFELDLVTRTMPVEMRALMQPHIVPAADHQFTPLHAQRDLCALMQEFVTARTTVPQLAQTAQSEFVLVSEH
jgi:pimeloyl-ACP methyl ester carboxylesterase